MIIKNVVPFATWCDYQIFNTHAHVAYPLCRFSACKQQQQKKRKKKKILSSLSPTRYQVVTFLCHKWIIPILFLFTKWVTPILNNQLLWFKNICDNIIILKISGVSYRICIILTHFLFGVIQGVSHKFLIIIY